MKFDRTGRKKNSPGSEPLCKFNTLTTDHGTSCGWLALQTWLRPGNVLFSLVRPIKRSSEYSSATNVLRILMIHIGNSTYIYLSCSKQECHDDCHRFCVAIAISIVIRQWSPNFLYLHPTFPTPKFSPLPLNIVVLPWIHIFWHKVVFSCKFANKMTFW